MISIRFVQRFFEFSNHVFVERIDMICPVERFMMGHEYRFEVHRFEAGECVQKMVEQMVVASELNKGGRGVYHVVAAEQYLFRASPKHRCSGAWPGVSIVEIVQSPTEMVSPS